jgi:hypothetical protein
MRQLVKCLAVLLATHVSGALGAELSLPSLTISGEVYSNVVVTPSSQGRLMVRHGAGIGTVRLVDLDYEVLTQLVDAEIIGGRAAKELLARKAPKKTAKISQVTTNENGEVVVEEVEATLQARATLLARSAQTRLENEARALGFRPAHFEQTIARLPREAMLGIAGGIVLLYLLRCWCFLRICQRSTGRGSILVFLPLLRWFPLAEAARMSRHWVAVPVFGLLMLQLPPALPQLPWVPLAYLAVVGAFWVTTAILFVVWCVKICKVLQHSMFFSLLLLLPVLDWFALLYLACSGGKAEEKISLNSRPVAI